MQCHGRGIYKCPCGNNYNGTYQASIVHDVCLFLLSEPHDSSSSEDRRGQRDKDTSVANSNLSLSLDLNDSIHVMSVGVRACTATMIKLGSIFQSNDDNYGGDAKNIEGNQSLSWTSKRTISIISHGCSSIHKALKFAIGQKLLDIA